MKKSVMEQVHTRRRCQLSMREHSGRTPRDLWDTDSPFVLTVSMAVGVMPADDLPALGPRARGEGGRGKGGVGGRGDRPVFVSHFGQFTIIHASFIIMVRADYSTRGACLAWWYGARQVLSGRTQVLSAGLAWW